MDEYQEPAELADSGAGETEATSRRIDQFLASAVEDQLKEQRDLAALITEVKETAVAVRAEVQGIASVVGDTIEGRIAALQEGTRQTLARMDSTAEERLARLESSTQQVTTRLESNTQQASVRLDEASALVLDSVEQRLSGLETTLKGLVAGIASTTDERVSGLETVLKSLVTGITSTTDERVSGLETTLETLAARIENAQEDAVDRLADAGLDRIEGMETRLSSELTALISEGWASQESTGQVLAERLTAGVSAIREGLDAGRQASQESQSAIERGIAEESSRIRDAVVAARADQVTRLDHLESDIQTTLRDAVAAAEEEMLVAVETLRARLADEVEGVRGAYTSLVTSVERASGLVSESNTRIGSVEAGIVRYMEERDRALERARSEMVREVLEEFAADLGGKERRKIAERLQASLEHRRDHRDAEELRAMRGATPVRPTTPMPAPATGLPTARPTPRSPARIIVPEDAEGLDELDWGLEEPLASTSKPKAFKSATRTTAARRGVAETSKPKGPTAAKSAPRTGATKRGTSHAGSGMAKSKQAKPISSKAAVKPKASATAKPKEPKASGPKAGTARAKSVATVEGDTGRSESL